MSYDDRRQGFSDDSTMSWNTERVRRGDGARREYRGDSGYRERRGEPPHRQPQQKRRRRRRNPMAGVVYVLIVLMISALLAGIGWLLCNDLLALNKEEHSAEIVVTADDKLGSVATALKKAGLIEYKFLFLLYGSMSDTELSSGTYVLNTNMDYHALLTAMSAKSGVRKTVDVTIPEGYTNQQIFELLEEKNVNTVEELTAVAANGDFDYTFLADKPKGLPSRLEGYLFPDTYQFYCGGDPKAVVDKMLKNFDNKMTDELMRRVEDSPYTLDEIIIIASLIEKETDGSDDGKISSVIRNRMKNSGETAGYLQIDASLLYGLGEHKEVLTDADKETDSPYNLYKYKGLPPTPIANPGISSIRAALYPENTSYYFYALGKDGVHHFFRTYREHVNFLNSQNG